MSGTIHGKGDWVFEFARALCSHDQMQAEQLFALRDAREVDLPVVAAICEAFYKIKSGHVSARELQSQESFLERVRRLDEQGNLDDALDLLYDSIDEYLRGGLINDIDSLLGEVDVSDYSDDVLIGLLTATLPARTKLPSRVRLLERLRQRLEQSGQSDPRLLSGL